MENALRQPDFSQIATSFREAADQFASCANLPAVDGSVRLLQQMETMTQRLALVQETMQRGFADARERIDALDRRMRIMNKNVTARMLNGRVMHRGVFLRPLYDESNGEVIPGCPDSLEALDALSDLKVIPCSLNLSGELVARRGGLSSRTEDMIHNVAAEQVFESLTGKSSRNEVQHEAVKPREQLALSSCASLDRAASKL
ncbi:hypothetical protein MY11210_004765 [Beauveria gryllotalpidicola]